MAPKYTNGEEYFHKLYTRFNASIAASLLPLAWLMLKLQSQELYSIIGFGTLYWVFTVSVLVGSGCLMYWSIIRFKTDLKSLSEQDSLRDKLNTYYSLSNKKYFDFLLIALMMVCGLYISANTLFIIGYIIGLVLLSLRRPTLSIFIEDLKLSEADRTILLEKQKIS